MSSIIKALPKAQAGGSSSSNRGLGSETMVELQQHNTAQYFDGRTQVQQELHLHDQRTQHLSIGVDPEVYARAMSEAQQVLDEAETRASHFEGLAKELYTEANRQIHDLKMMVEQLHQSCVEKDQAIQNSGAQIQQLTSSSIRFAKSFGSRSNSMDR